MLSSVVISMNHAITKLLMRSTHIPELLSWTQPIPTLGQDCSYFAAATPRDLISITHPCPKTFTRKPTRTTLVPLPAPSGRVERLKWHNLLRTKELQHGSTTGPEQSLISPLHSNFPNQTPMTRETEDSKAPVPRRLAKSRLVLTKNHPAIHQFGNSTRHRQK
jgi:hypothetical protein